LAFSEVTKLTLEEAKAGLWTPKGPLWGNDHGLRTKKKSKTNNRTQPANAGLMPAHYQFNKI